MLKLKEGYQTQTLKYNCLYCGDTFDKTFKLKSGPGGVVYPICKIVQCQKCRNFVPYDSGK
jgi:hypothetical protein